MPTPLETLHRRHDARVLIPHVDDVGGSHGSNVSMVELARAGFVTCGSAMVPSGWFAETAALAAEHPELDIGVHLTLTSESVRYRWRPLTTGSPASGLVDDDGFMWSDVVSVRRNAAPDAVEAELRAQVEAALAAGIDVTHLDHHMGAAVAPEFVAATVRIARDHDLPIMLPADLESFYDVMDQPPGDLSPVVPVRDDLAASGELVVDRFWMGLTHRSSDAVEVGRRAVAEAPPGVTFLSLHCAADSDITAIHPRDAAWRIAEDAIFRDSGFVEWAARQDVELIGFREIRELLRAHRRGQPAAIPSETGPG